MFTDKTSSLEKKDKELVSFWNYILLGVIVFTIFISEISLYIFSEGSTMLISHLFYFPLFFLIFRYSERGLTISITLGILYLLLIFYMSGDNFYNLIAGILFFFAFIGIGTGSSVLAGNLKSSESKLREFKKHYQNLFENTNDSVFVHNMDGDVLICNKHARYMFGIEDGHKKRLNLNNLGKLLETTVFEESKELLLKTGQANLETSITTASGEKRYIEVSSSITDSQEGYVHVFIRDISERKNVQLALEESESRFRVLTNQIPEMIFELDDEGSITFATRYSLNMFGYEPRELTSGMKFWDILADSEMVRAKQNYEWFLSGHIVGPTEYLGKRKDSSNFQVMMNMSYMFSGSDIKGLRGIAIDISQRKAMETALKSSEKKYRSLFENSNDAVLIFSKDGRIIDVNQSLTSMLGYSRDYVLAGSIYNFYPPDRHEYIKSVLSDIETTKNTFFETELLKNDGSTAVVDVSTSLVSAEEGIIQFVLRDITDKKKAEEALIESESNYRNLTDLLPQIVFELDREGNVTFANKNAFESFIVDREDLLKGIKFWEVLAPEDQDKAKETFLWMLSGYDNKRAYEYMAQRTDGTKFHMLVYVSLIIKGGEVTGARGIGIDISGRKKMEEALLVSEERLNLAIQGAGVCVWDWDMEKDHMYFSGNYQEMFGYPADGRSCSHSDWREILQVQFFSDVMEFFTGVIDVEEKGFDPEKHNFESEYHMKCKNGTYKWISVMGKIAGWDAEGIPLRIVGIMQDVSQIKRYQDAISEANRKLNLLSSITRHDILNQIAGINGFTDLMYRKVGGDEDLIHHLDRIKQASGNIQEQITFTRDYHNVGVESPQWQRVDNIAMKMKAKAKTWGIVFDVNCGPLEIYADPMLEKIFFNFIDNAVRHGQKVTQIELSFKNMGDLGVIVIQDDGVGVPENLKSRIFDHGFGANTGLGLFLTKEILSITGLKIVETGLPGEGARFEIKIPPENFRFAKSDSE
ncbi:MAG: PAS domain S-box protein [Methanomicrobiaceae archaeon]|nr:PAS domain S-box protein [Methanomicrobiaceae archaeon]